MTPEPSTETVDLRAINTIRFLAVDMVEAAKSGHPGLPLGAAPMAYVLWMRHLRHNPRDPSWWNRDRFVLSAGHGSALLYALLHLTGYDLPLEELRRFRQWGSLTPGHPEFGLTPGVEATTGPLGQGFAMGVGMAIAEQHLASRFNRPDLPIVDHWTYGLVSDGDLMEGISSEAASLAGTMRLRKLLYLYDDNHVSLEGGTNLAFTEDVARRFEAYHWQVLRVTDGNDLAAIDSAITTARREADRPSVIIVRTHIGYGSPRQDSYEAHGEPLGPAGTKATKEKLGWPIEPAFLVPEDVRSHFLQSIDRGILWEKEWNERLSRYRTEHSELARTFEGTMRRELPSDWEDVLPRYTPDQGPIATRDASGQTLNQLASRIPGIIGGSGDLSPSTKTTLKGSGDFGVGTDEGRNLHYGVREHAMVGMVNGMALHGGVIPYGATFLVFSDYARGAIRIGALMKARSILIFTHDSIGLGEDGPTHQPVEQLTALRAIPGLTVLRPADANETVFCWREALRRNGPVALVLTRQKLPVIATEIDRIQAGVPRGAYVLEEASGDSARIVLVSTGSEVSLALEARKRLEAQGVPCRVVSMPSWELFDEQDLAYRDGILSPGLPKLAIEAGRSFGWWKYVGSRGGILGVDRFGASAPGPVVMENLGLTPEHVIALAMELLHPQARAGPSAEIPGES